jgi:hypothetical protein
MLDLQHSQYSLNLPKKLDSTILSNTETFSLSYSTDEIERMKLCGILFDRRASVKKDYIDEFFRKEPCLYDEATYKYAARIFHCLKVDLNENPILKSLKHEQEKVHEMNKIADVPKINYKNNQEKKNTFKLAFSVLRCKSSEKKKEKNSVLIKSCLFLVQRLLEQLFDECQFYAKYPDVCFLCLKPKLVSVLK